MDESNGLLADLAQGFVELLWPTRCIGCDRTGVLLCSQCDSQLPRIDQTLACSRCGAPFGKILCTECFDSQGAIEFSFSAAVAALEFEGTAVRLVKGYKDQHERRLSVLMAHILYQIIPADWFDWAAAISYIPADSRAIKRRGFDHMREIATELSGLAGLPVAHLLRKCVAADQRLLTRAAREENISAAFELRSSQAGDADGSRVLCSRLPARLLLIDDVLTTGATMEAATRTLLQAGVDDIRVAVVTRVW